MSFNPHPLNLATKVLSWAHLNFKLQSFVHQQQKNISSEVLVQLRSIGYEGRCIADLEEREYKRLFEKESFFSSSQTGKRIAAFALELNGLNQDYFEEIEKSITHAYTDIKDTYEKTSLLEKSYQHSLDTLYVFKL